MIYKHEMTYKGYPIDIEKIVVKHNSDGTKTVIIPDTEGNIISIETMTSNSYTLRIMLKVVV